MGTEHERVAQSIGPGPTMLRGAAGTGKTMAICARARHLRERHPAWQILVLCFNTSLASLLRLALPADPRTEVATFHDWAQARLDASGVAIPPPPAAGAYQAILIDEGPDFVGDWYRALAQALDRSTDELLVALDPAQNIYGREVAWGDLGLGCAGQTRILEVNHRNSPPIAAAACRLVQSLDGDAGGGRPRPDPAEVTLAGGSPPEMHRGASFGSSRADAHAWIRDRRARGVPARNLLVLGVNRLDMITVNAWLNSKGVDAWLPAVTPDAAGVRVSTIHGARGLEADGVLLLDAHHLQTRGDAEARRLLYIAMTRARHDLAISYFRDVPLMTELTAACAIA